MRLLTSLVLALALLFAACGDGTTATGDDPTGTSATGAADGVVHTATSTVLESPDHGPQLCLGGVGESLPPQCGGLDLVGWDWAAVEGEESVAGTTWGTYTVVGTYDGESLTLTEPAREPDPDRGDDEVEIVTPCPEPEGGWRVVDPATTTDEAMSDAIAHARAQPDVGGVWLDQSINPAADVDPIDEMAMNDPTKLVLNLSFTGDLDRHEAEIRELWGGALCISTARISAAELDRIRGEVQAEVDHFWWSSTDEVEGSVVIGVTVDDGLQALFDERYGVGIVDVRPSLVPVTG